MKNARECVLHDRPCTECGECDLCDLDPQKICDNCMRCVSDEETDFRAIRIDGVLTPEESTEGEEAQ